ncbi:DUF3800 domain-containing protein [Corallincola platygyrae]|uniref:DUF3800 domain-containing protein n=1 Tax=Corallincola platygyrae TaxID=1193278 RepID=A0ABW4XIQ9_9GAMM
MNELIFETEKGQFPLSEQTFVVVLDDTGHEQFQDPNYRVFGLGGCAFLAKDYLRLIEKPWNYMCEHYFAEEERPLHATDIRFSSEQMGALKHFFEKFEFFRIATTTSYKVDSEVDERLIDIVGASLLQRIVDVAKWADFDRMFIIFESSDRIESKVMRSLSGKKVTKGAREIEIELAVMPKSTSFPALEVADFIAHTAGTQTRSRNEGEAKIRADFDIIFRSIDGRLVSFMEITKACEAGNA